MVSGVHVQIRLVQGCIHGLDMCTGWWVRWPLGLALDTKVVDDLAVVHAVCHTMVGALTRTQHRGG